MRYPELLAGVRMIGGAGVSAGHSFRTGTEAGPTVARKNLETTPNPNFAQTNTRLEA